MIFKVKHHIEYFNILPRAMTMFSLERQTLNVKFPVVSIKYYQVFSRKERC